MNRIKYSTLLVFSLALALLAGLPITPARAKTLQALEPSLATARCTPTPVDPFRIMPLGDSLTRGSTGDPEVNGYRKALFDALVNLGYNIRFVGSRVDGTIPSPNNQHEGHTGYHAREDDPNVAANDIYRNISSWLVAKPADAILLHIGTNDVEFGTASAGEIGEILDKVDQWDQGSGALEEVPVVVARIFNQNPRIQLVTDYNQSVASLVNDRISSQHDLLRLVDMEAVMNSPSLYYDALHPNVSGYQKIAKEWEKALYELLPICAANDTLAGSVLDGTPVTIPLAQLAANDAGGGLKITSVGSFSNGGSATIINGGEAIVYTSYLFRSGTETFTYQVQAPASANPFISRPTANATVTVTITEDPSRRAFSFMPLLLDTASR